MVATSPVSRWLQRVHVKSNSLTHAVLIAVVFITLLPLAWTILSSFKGPVEIYTVVPAILWINHPTLENYIWVFQHLPQIGLQLRNSLFVTLGSVALRTFIASLAGYAFARLRFRWRDAIFGAFVAAIFIPRFGALMGSYELLALLHLRNSLWGLILSYGSGLSIGLFIMRQTFLAIPSELEDAGRIDGANPFQIFLHIAVPMATGGMLVVAITTFVQVWGDFLFAYTMLDEPTKSTIAIAVSRFDQQTAYLTDPTIAGFGVQSAAYTLSMLPVIIVFVLLQRWFIRGITEGVLKM